MSDIVLIDGQYRRKSIYRIIEHTKITGATSSTMHFRISSPKSELSDTKIKMETSLSSLTPAPKKLFLRHGASIELLRVGSPCFLASSLRDPEFELVLR